MAGRRRKAGKTRTPEDQTSIAMRAFEMKNSAPLPERPQTRTSRKGMRPLPNEKITPEGALEAEGARPAMERSHKAR